MKNKYENIYLVELHDIIYLYKIISLIDSEYENNIYLYSKYYSFNYIVKLLNIIL